MYAAMDISTHPVPLAAQPVVEKGTEVMISRSIALPLHGQYCEYCGKKTETSCCYGFKKFSPGQKGINVQNGQMFLP